MKFRFGFSLFLFLFSLVSSVSAVEENPSAPQTPAEHFPFVGVVTGNRVNLRSGPSSSTDVFHQLFRGDQVFVVAREGDWYAVQLPPEASVYVSAPYLSSDANGRFFIRGRNVRARSGAGLAYGRLGLLPEGFPVRVQRIAGDWAQLQAPETCRGWVSCSYVTFLASANKEFMNGDDRAVSRNPAQSGPNH